MPSTERAEGYLKDKIDQYKVISRSPSQARIGTRCARLILACRPGRAPPSFVAVPSSRSRDAGNLAPTALRGAFVGIGGVHMEQDPSTCAVSHHHRFQTSRICSFRRIVDLGSAGAGPVRGDHSRPLRPILRARLVVACDGDCAFAVSARTFDKQALLCATIVLTRSSTFGVDGLRSARPFPEPPASRFLTMLHGVHGFVLSAALRRTAWIASKLVVIALNAMHRAVAWCLVRRWPICSRITLP